MSEDIKELPLRKFRVIVGTHIQNKKSYTKGKIVKSTKDLTKAFVGKFVEVGRQDIGAEEETPTPVKASGVKAK